MASFGSGRVSLARRIAGWRRPALRAAAGVRADNREVCIESDVCLLDMCVACLLFGLQLIYFKNMLFVVTEQNKHNTIMQYGDRL